MFQVRWKQSALDELAELWIQADSATRKIITAATNQLDQELAQDPQNVGESRSGFERICFLFPLGIRFEVDNQQAKVQVLQVWSYRKK